MWLFSRSRSPARKTLAGETLVAGRRRAKKACEMPMMPILRS
jgi:hypothetical protein